MSSTVNVPITVLPLAAIALSASMTCYSVAVRLGVQNLDREKANIRGLSWHLGLTSVHLIGKMSVLSGR